MFEGIKEYLASLTPQEKQALITNLQDFSRLKNVLESNGCLKKDTKTGNLIIQKDHIFIKQFIKVYQNLTMRGVVLIDNRRGDNFVIPPKKDKK